MNIKLIFTTLLLLTAHAINIWAIPAYPRPITVKTDNGKEVLITMRGDENLKYALTTDGYTLISDNSGWWYAEADEQGRIVKSGHKLMAIEDEDAGLRNFKTICPKGLIPMRDTITSVRRTPGTRYANGHKTAIGERRALVILMEYPDLRFKTSYEDFENLFNAVDYHEDGVTGSVRDFYRFASQGQLDYVSDVYGPYMAMNTMNYYGGNTTMGGNDAHAVDLCIEAMKSLPDTIDFTKYDNDNDGLIDNVHIIFAGYGEEAGGPSTAIWSHEYPHRIILTSEIGYSLAGYSCSPELRSNRGSSISYIGVVCHELGHALGAMDYYDTNYGTGGEYDGTGKWDIMASGSWNDNGQTPPNFNPYVRSVIFGWNDQQILQPDEQVVMPKMEVGNAEQTKVYRMNTGSSNDYFLLENRQQQWFDAALPGAGLMVYHVHPNLERYRSTNTINATHPQMFYPVCAGYSDPSIRKYGNINSTECPFPGISHSTTFTPTTSPSAVAWNGSAATVSIQNITQYASSGEIAFSTGGDIIVGPDDTNEPMEKNILYKESFEGNITDNITITNTQGNAGWQTYKKGNFVLGASDIPKATDGDRILMLFASKSNIVSESEAIGPYIEIEAGKSYTLALDLYMASDPNRNISQFTLFMEDDYGEYKMFSQNEFTDKWQSVDLPMVFAGNRVRYKLHGRIVTGGIFVDNLRLLAEELPSSIATTDVVKGNECRNIYSIMGVRLSQKKRGINIVKKSDGTVIKFISR
ncbi:MAG: M6 family metalloprotease domain-containing protein [Prevotella sp.]|nr:M6 family metalloprotease domain-containing protein [Prevotella sp.]